MLIINVYKIVLHVQRAGWALTTFAFVYSLIFPNKKLGRILSAYVVCVLRKCRDPLARYAL